ncbi:MULTISPECIES: hypothetical protein [unclassified Leucobacter]|uniref:hypothetical protein n=1 Tax=unclassified Leucobacter TaxID=2621730 RepID=UPI0006212ACB|nr:hypothetical protein [Leucobacter sp. Ag1]KKI18740.1 hypothetical protein XM48_10720 [Leucobacter sp. Ag1]
MTLKLTNKRPDEELDGLQALEDRFTKGNPDDVVVVAVVSRHAITKTDPSDQWQATARFKHIEPVTGDDEVAVRRILSERYAKRTGNQPLPIPEPELDVEGGDDE